VSFRVNPAFSTGGLLLAVCKFFAGKPLYTGTNPRALPGGPRTELEPYPGYEPRAPMRAMAGLQLAEQCLDPAHSCSETAIGPY
jgi:hypothetical protein